MVGRDGGLHGELADDALIQPYSGHASRTSLEIYSKIALGAAQDTCNGVIDLFPV